MYDIFDVSKKYLNEEKQPKTQAFPGIQEVKPLRFIDFVFIFL